MSNEKQRVVLITGTSSGIGHACAGYLAERGFRVYGTSRRAAPGTDSSVDQRSAAMLPLDVTDDRSVVSVVEEVLSREGRLDIVVNNAGMGIAGPVECTSIEEARKQLDVNFFGAFRVCHAALPAMRRQGSGYIVNIGSIGGLIAIPYQAMYSASKFALEGLSEALRLEVRSMGIRVVLIEPGDHRTAFTGNRQRTEISGEDGIHRRHFLSALERMIQCEQSGPGPERVARLVHRIVNLPDPRLRYTVGPSSQRAAVWLKRFLPHSMVEWGIRKYYLLDD